MSEEDVEQFYNTPSHLSTSGSIGIIPDRTFYVGLGAILIGALPAYAGLVHFGPRGLAIGGITFLLAIPFSLWFLSPPFEHGLVHLFVHIFSRKTLHPQHLRYLKDVRIVDDVIYLNPEPSTECLAVLSLPTLNLDLASVSSKRRHRRQFGMLLDGISTHQFQIVVRSETLPNTSALERMRLNRNPFARRLADWLADHHKQQQAIDRRRYLILPADNPENLVERIETISRSFRQVGLDPERLSDPADLRDMINNWWTWRPHAVRLGPETVIRSAKHLQIDGDFVRIFAFGKLPTVIQTNWWYRLIDGDLPCDISMSMKQQELSLAKWRLDLKYNALASSNTSPSRQIALEQVRQLRLAFETRVRPWNVQILLIVRGHDLKTLDKVSNRLKQQCKDIGGEIRLLRWEQVEGMQAAQPLCGYMLPSRPLYLESGTLARTTPLSASTLQMLDGVPWGLSGSTPILLTTKGMRTGRHFGWYGSTGAGKGFGVRCYLARRYFADRLRVFMWDADDAQHEYAGRFTTFLQGIRLELNTPEDVDNIQIDPRWQVVAFDVSGMNRDLQPQAFAKVKHLVEEHVLAFPGETAFVVDEATTLAEHTDQTGARALGDAVQTWRKRGIECHIITQRVTDWFGTAIGRKIQGNLAVKWYGAQEDSELYEVARRVNLSTEERDRIGAAGIGEGLLVAFGRRVWANLYDQCSEDEYRMYSTDPPERVEILASRREAAIA